MDWYTGEYRGIYGVDQGLPCLMVRFHPLEHIVLTCLHLWGRNHSVNAEMTMMHSCKKGIEQVGKQEKVGDPTSVFTICLGPIKNANTSLVCWVHWLICVCLHRSTCLGLFPFMYSRKWGSAPIHLHVFLVS